MGQLIAVLICLSPLLFLSAGYYVGRFGSPLVIKRQSRRDRRVQSANESDPEVEVYTAQG
jgi:hypothetical protein